MPEFLELLPPDEALQVFLSQLKPELHSERVNLNQSLGRVTFRGIQSPQAFPYFTRSTVDGFAVRAEDTYGASDTLPAYLIVIGEVKMGTSPGFQLTEGQCALIHTGGMLPSGANAVIMVEHTQDARENEIEAFRAVAEGENIIKEGEDVTPGQEVIPAGMTIRPAEIGGLAALGINDIEVSRQPRVAIISSGDEIIPPDAEIQPGQVRDINTFTLSALITAHGGIPISYGILPDRLEALVKTARRALQECDMVIFTAGSSASVRDLTADTINSLGKPGVCVHGVNVRPGKPTILAACAPDGNSTPKPVIGLPGNPISALVIANLFAVPALRILLGLPGQTFKPSITASLEINIASQAGREDWIAVNLVRSHEGWIARPVFGKSNFIFSMIRADGLIRIPPAATGLSAGALVEVFLL